VPDLRLSGAKATEAERQAIDAVAVEARRDLLLPALHAVNDRVGWISRGAADHIAARLQVAPADVYGVASFYASFSLEPRPPRVLHLCVDLACQAAGAEALAESLEGREGWVRSPCLGLCERAPAALVTDYGKLRHDGVVAPAEPAELSDALERGAAACAAEPAPAGAVPQAGEAGVVLLRRIGAVDPESLDDYRAAGGYAALRRAVELGPEGVIGEVTASGLVGRGGAAFPAGRKWEAVAGEPARPHELVCNADESEPGTFKDRVLLEGDPFAVIEAMTIAGYATGCERGHVYLRGEYPRARSILEGAIDAARQRGFLGDDVMGLGFAFDIEVRRGAGAYICGEETAIFNSIEGYRGEPRSKPPFPTQRGLFGRPTLVNNVETLVNVLPILQEGGAAFAATGSGRSTGTKLFAVCGTLSRPGVYEVPFGVTLGELLELAGGLQPGRRLRAVLLGGAAGAFVGPDALDLPLTFEAVAAAGATLGSGAVMVLDDTVELVPFLLRIAAFFRDESCGQCVPCRVGTVRQEEALHRLAAGAPLGSTEADLTRLRDVGAAMRDASICGLGQTAWNAIESALDRLEVLR
jgi:NADH-quinone oxidoreductase subunit F